MRPRQSPGIVESVNRLIGREAELATLRELVVSGTGALVVRGEAGIGKTSLLAAAAGEAGKARVLRAAGSTAERDLEGAGLHRLLGKVPHGGDRLELATAVLDELAALAPVVCAIDDADRLDRTSRDALAFAARRIDGAPIVLLFAGREPIASDLPELRLGRLERPAAAALLDAAPGRLSPHIRERLLDAADGNPLALTELPRALTRDQLDGREAAPEPLPVTPRVEALFAAELARLGARAQTLLLVAAAETGNDLATLRRAATTVGAGLDDLDELERAGFLRTSDRSVELCHPLLRPLVYHAASFGSRRRAHEALAAVHQDALRRALHRAAGAVEDPALAADLEAAARERDPATRADALERAALLTADLDERARRLVAAAESSRLAGRSARALALAAAALQLTGSPVRRAEATRVRALVTARSGSATEAFAALVAAADETAPLDASLAAALLADAVAVARDEGDGPSVLAAARRAAGLPTVDREALDTAYGTGEVLAGQVADGLRLLDGDEPLTLLYRGDFASARRRLLEEIAALRERRLDGLLPAALGRLALAEAAEGRFDAAAETATEGLALARATEQGNCALVHRAVLAWVAAAHGREEECRSAAAEVLRLAARHELRVPAQVATAALGELELALGRPEEAFARFAQISDHVVGLVAAASLVEAAVRTDRREAAVELVDGLERWVEAPALRALLARCHALLDSDDERLVDAVRLHAEAGRSFDEARTRLLYGESLRRARRRREAREHLQAALDAFERLDAAAWAARARSELRGSGLTVRRADPSLLDRLTPQELQVARIVAAGATNKQVAAQLYLSPRTIDFHLRNVFAKLGITSRFQLAALRADVLDTGDVADATARRAA
jgi:DNA-binding CsgD family transcriptional regulator